MRVTEFAQHQREGGEQPQRAAAASGIGIAIMRFTWRGWFPCDRERYRRFTTGAVIFMAGMRIWDAVVEPLHYAPDGRSIETIVTGTVPIYTWEGILDAIEQVKKAELKIVGLGMVGRGLAAEVSIGEAVTLVAPDSGDSITLLGADR